MIELDKNAKRNRFELGLSTPELKELKIRAKARGFSSVSHFLRYMCLRYDAVIENKINETNKNVKEILEIIKKDQPK